MGKYKHAKKKKKKKRENGKCLIELMIRLEFKLSFVHIFHFLVLCSLSSDSHYLSMAKIKLFY